MGPVSDLAMGMGWSIYLMLGMVALVVGSIVLMIVRSERKRLGRTP
jgi:NADH:ubiquinone oxidoreductase subunit H